MNLSVLLLCLSAVFPGKDGKKTFGWAGSIGIPNLSRRYPWGRHEQPCGEPICNLYQ